METVPMNKSGNYNHRIGNPNRNFVNNRNLYSFPSDDLIFLNSSILASGQFGGIPLYNSYPPAGSILRAPVNLRHQQPPLLPLPISSPVQNINMNIYRSNSCSNNNNIRLSPPRINKTSKNRVRGRDQSLTPKKSKNQKKNSKPEEPDLVASAVTESLIGPDPKDLPKDVISMVLNPSVNKSCDKFSGSVVFTPSPPPSSLPLPTFSLRPKLSCKAQAAGVDAGATDGLRRLLRI